MAGVLRSDWIGPEPEAFRAAQSRGCHVFRLWQEGLLRAGLLSLAEAIGTERPSVRLRLVIDLGCKPELLTYMYAKPPRQPS